MASHPTRNRRGYSYFSEDISADAVFRRPGFHKNGLPLLESRDLIPLRIIHLCQLLH